MPKRSSTDKLERYYRKIRKIEETERRRLARVLVSSDSDDGGKNSDTDTVIGHQSEEIPAVQTETVTEITEGIIGTTEEVPAVSQVPQQNVPDLDPDILDALGVSTELTPTFGPPIHEKLAQRWDPLLKRGLPNDDKEKLLKLYPVPQNCTLLQAPKLNAEISAAITDMAKNREKKMESIQQQLGVGITAINIALTTLITSGDKIETIKLLSDGCRILTDLHFMETQSRIKMLTPGLDRSFLNVIKDSERDDTLFGSKLSDKIKASKVIEKQGLQIKKSTAPLKTSSPATIQSTVVRSRYQENWASPSRYPSSRGGRGGFRKTIPAARRALPAQQKPVNLNKTKPLAPQ